ncbi:MAG: hypothetical protein CVT48_04025 [Thermoplasmata archaeon HGW-Thermoplasmata-1]|nr:MAG: hypothetical protein CVT48_04025 [Thermoplasmata archaeon HGW-Thermoplasmata-1]
MKSLPEVFTDAHRTLTRMPTPPITASFYPYAGLRHTVRRSGRTIVVRVSDIMRDAPPEALFSLACILLGKALRFRRCPQNLERPYREWSKSPRIREAGISARRERGRKRMNGTAGAHYDLDILFDGINVCYFGGELPKPKLTWSARRTYRSFGHHDPAMETIVISRTLDDGSVPLFVVEYVLYHEMLHKKLGHIYSNSDSGSPRRMVHTREFREEEKKFEKYEEAVKTLQRLSRIEKNKQRRK